MKIDYEEIAYNKLTGKYKHYCWEWDFMAIDESYPEFAHCTCYGDDEVAFAAREVHLKEQGKM